MFSSLTLRSLKVFTIRVITSLENLPAKRQSNFKIPKSYNKTNVRCISSDSVITCFHKLTKAYADRVNGKQKKKRKHEQLSVMKLKGDVFDGYKQVKVP